MNSSLEYPFDCDNDTDIYNILCCFSSAEVHDTVWELIKKSCYLKKLEHMNYSDVLAHIEDELGIESDQSI